MTYKIFFLFSLFLHFSTFGKEFNEDKYYKLGLVLGVLKYHDSEISNGKQDWNKISLKIIEEVEVINSEIEFEKMSFTGLNAYYPNGLKVFGNGIKLDYKLNPTTKDLNPEYYVKKALEILKN